MVVELDVPPGTTLSEAFEQSGIDAMFPEDDLASLPQGIFGELAAESQVLEAYDRVEIYRPLKRDPIVARRERVAAARQGGDDGRGRSDE